MFYPCCVLLKLMQTTLFSVTFKIKVLTIVRIFYYLRTVHLRIVSTPKSGHLATLFISHTLKKKTTILFCFNLNLLLLCVLPLPVLFSSTRHVPSRYTGIPCWESPLSTFFLYRIFFVIRRSILQEMPSNLI